jgi:glycosyltransferase involved in cell wall biosynthesis
VTISSYPKITIVTAVFNNVEFIEACLQSVLSQAYPNLEYIVVDGGSTDGTVDVLKKYESQLSVLISEPDKGQSDALNKGFYRSTGDIIGWLNADERYEADTLGLVGREFAAAPGLDFFYGNRIVVDVDGVELERVRWTPLHPIRHILHLRTVLPTDASFWRRRIQNELKTLDVENFPHLGMDVDWFLRLSVQVKKWKKTSAFLVKYIDRDDRMTMLGVKENPNRPHENHELARKKLFLTHPMSRTRLAWGRFTSRFLNRLYRLTQR